MMDRLPNLLIAGAPKAGTSSLYRWIADHPQALGSLEKETCYFADPGTHVHRPAFNPSHGLDVYRSAFPEPHPETRVIIEATPSYIYSQTALEHAPNLPDRPRFLFVLRDPASQIRSIFEYYRNNWSYIPHDMSFEDYLAAVRSGGHDFGGNELARGALQFADYRPWLENWRARLEPDRMKVITHDRLQEDPASSIAEIAEWCGLDPGFYADYKFPSENESYVPRNRSLQRLNMVLRARLPKGKVYDAARRLYRKLNTRSPDKDRDARILDALRREFAPANARLQEDFGLDLSSWMPGPSSEYQPRAPRAPS